MELSSVGSDTLSQSSSCITIVNDPLEEIPSRLFEIAMNNVKNQSKQIEVGF